MRRMKSVYKMMKGREGQHEMKKTTARAGVDEVADGWAVSQVRIEVGKKERSHLSPKIMSVKCV